MKTPCAPAWARGLVVLGACSMLMMPVAAHAADAPVRKAEWAQPVDASQNLYQVAPMFYRSARLQSDSVKTLQSLGIRTVVSLRAFHSDHSVLDSTDIRQVRVKVYTWDIDDREVIAALRAIRSAEADGPVLVHCLHGADRTGLMVAMYRMVYQGWSREAALDELENGGFGYHAIWKNIPRYLKKVDVARIKAAVETTAPAPDKRD